MRTLYIDSNIWNYLFENKIDLRAEFPANNYELLLVSEQELENIAIPEDLKDKKELKKFINCSIDKWGIKIDKYFGFYDARHPEDEQRLGGLDEGRWASTEELDFMKEMKEKMGKTKKKSRLYKNETDIALAARSINAIVLTFDAKKGPLKIAKDRGWGVVFLSGYDISRENLYEYVTVQSGSPAT